MQKLNESTTTLISTHHHQPRAELFKSILASYASVFVFAAVNEENILTKTRPDTNKKEKEKRKKKKKEKEKKDRERKRERGRERAEQFKSFLASYASMLFAADNEEHVLTKTRPDTNAKKERERERERESDISANAYYLFVAEQR